MSVLCFSGYSKFILGNTINEPNKLSYYSISALKCEIFCQLVGCLVWFDWVGILPSSLPLSFSSSNGIIPSLFSLVSLLSSRLKKGLAYERTFMCALNSLPSLTSRVTSKWLTNVSCVLKPFLFWLTRFHRVLFKMTSIPFSSVALFCLLSIPGVFCVWRTDIHLQ